MIFVMVVGEWVVFEIVWLIKLVSCYRGDSDVQRRQDDPSGLLHVALPCRYFHGCLAHREGKATPAAGRGSIQGKCQKSRDRFDNLGMSVR